MAAGAGADMAAGKDIELGLIPFSDGCQPKMTTDPPPDPRRDLLDRIESVLDTHVRPGLRADGGDVELVGIDDDRIVQVRLLGACQGCASSSYTLTMGVEAEVKARVPEVRFLEAVL